MEEMTNSEFLESIGQKPIYVYTKFRTIMGTSSGGIILSYLMGELEKSNKITKIDSELVKETGASVAQVRAAKIKFKQLPFLKITLEGIPQRTVYQLKEKEFKKYMEKFHKEQEAK